MSEDRQGRWRGHAGEEKVSRVVQLQGLEDKGSEGSKALGDEYEVSERLAV